MINQEILNTLEEKKFISSFQLEQIKDKIKDFCDSDFKDFYKHYKDYFNHKKKLTFKQFVNELIDYLIKDVDNESFKILDDYTISEIEKENRVYSFYDNLENESIEDLKSYDLDNERFNNFEYWDNIIIEEDIKNCLDLNDNEYKNLDFSDSRENTYISIKGIDLLSEFECYDSFNEFFEDLDNLIYSIDLKQQVYIRFILDNDLFNCYLSYDNKGLIKLDNDIKKEISKILEKNLKDNKKELRKEKKLKKELETELKKVKKPIIKDSIKVNIEKIDNHINTLNQINKLIFSDI